MSEAEILNRKTLFDCVQQMGPTLKLNFSECDSAWMRFKKGRQKQLNHRNIM